MTGIVLDCLVRIVLRMNTILKQQKLCPIAWRTNCVEELTDKIIKTFIEYFDEETFNASRKEVRAVAENILKDKNYKNRMRVSL